MNGSIQSWYRWFIGKDFIETLKEYGRLPLEMTVEKLMNNMKERDDLVKTQNHAQEMLAQVEALNKE